MKTTCLNLFIALALISIQTSYAKQVTSNVGPLCSPMVEFQGKMYFCAEHPTLGKEVHIADGGQFGTKVLRDIDTGLGDSTPRAFFKLNGYLYFFAENTALGEGLWRTDGTEEGTKMVISISQQFGAKPTKVVEQIGGNVYFQGAVGTSRHDHKLFVTNGSVGGTHPIDVPIYNGIFSSLNVISATTYQVYNNQLFLLTLRNLYRIDSNQQATLVYENLPFDGDQYPLTQLTRLTFLGKMLVEANGELWLSDGTTAGTQPYIALPNNYIMSLSVINDRLIYETGRPKYHNPTPEQEPQPLQLIATNGSSSAVLEEFERDNVHYDYVESVGYQRSLSWYHHGIGENAVVIGTAGSVNTTFKAPFQLASKWRNNYLRDRSPSDPAFRTIVEFAGKLYGHTYGSIARLDPITRSLQALPSSGVVNFLGAAQQGVITFSCLPNCSSGNNEIGIIGQNGAHTKLASVAGKGLYDDIYWNSIYSNGTHSYFQLRQAGIWHTNGSASDTYALKITYDDGKPEPPELDGFPLIPAIELLLDDEPEPVI